MAPPPPAQAKQEEKMKASTLPTEKRHMYIDEESENSYNRPTSLTYPVEKSAETKVEKVEKPVEAEPVEVVVEETKAIVSPPKVEQTPGKGKGKNKSELDSGKSLKESVHFELKKILTASRSSGDNFKPSSVLKTAPEKNRTEDLRGKLLEEIKNSKKFKLKNIKEENLFPSKEFLEKIFGDREGEFV